MKRNKYVNRVYIIVVLNIVTIFTRIFHNRLIEEFNLTIIVGMWSL